jgi:hypothetical protein
MSSLKSKLASEYGRVWDTQQLQKEFEVLGFAAGYVAVKRKFDGVKGSMDFTHMPRFYFNFKEHVD